MNVLLCKGARFTLEGERPMPWESGGRGAQFVAEGRSVYGREVMCGEETSTICANYME